MSLKIERETVKETVNQAVANHAPVNKGGLVGQAAVAVAEAATGNLPGTTGKHPISAVVGTALTGGRQNAGTKGYLAVCLPRDSGAPALQCAWP
jgi:hypothetical protein